MQEDAGELNIGLTLRELNGGASVRRVYATRDLKKRIDTCNMKELCPVLEECSGADVAGMITLHFMAMIVQRYARHYIHTAHRHTKAWPFLRIGLGVHPRIWADLERYAMLRREWKSEPESWIQELKVQPYLAYSLLTEARQGYRGGRL